jgi:hypothetical protein
LIRVPSVLMGVGEGILDFRKMASPLVLTVSRPTEVAVDDSAAEGAVFRDVAFSITPLLLLVGVADGCRSSICATGDGGRCKGRKGEVGGLPSC